MSEILEMNEFCVNPKFNDHPYSDRQNGGREG